MISIQRVQAGIAQYLDAEMMAQLPADGWRRVTAGAAIGVALKRMGAVTDELKKNGILNTMGVIDPDGNVDVEILRDELREKIPEDGMKIDVPLMGRMIFRKHDVDKVYQYITR